MSDAAPEGVTLNFEMACSSADFHRLLPAVAPVEYDAVLGQFSHVEDGRRRPLQLIEPRERTVGGCGCRWWMWNWCSRVMRWAISTRSCGGFLRISGVGEGDFAQAT